jgi:hypothetical protein
MARTALAAPLLIGGGMLVLTFGTANVFAASSATHANAPANTPQTSSKPHEHENVVCINASITAGGTCMVVFTDIKTKDEKNPSGQKVCFSVSPTTAGTATPFTPPCSKVTLVGGMYEALSTFSSNPNSCVNATIYATEPKEHNQRHHATETITCGPPGTATNASFAVPAGRPLPPAGGWLFGAMGAGVALVTSYALRRRFAPRRLAAGQSA